MENIKINEEGDLINLTTTAKNVLRLQRDAATKAAFKAAKSSTGILTPARKAAREKAKLAKLVAAQLSVKKDSLSDEDIKKIAGVESIQFSQPTLEDAQGGITTGSIGSPTMATGEPARFGSSAIYAPKVGAMLSRKGDIKLKKKKKVREFTEYYFSEEMNFKDDFLLFDDISELVANDEEFLRLMGKEGLTLDDMGHQKENSLPTPKYFNFIIKHLDELKNKYNFDSNYESLRKDFAKYV